MAELPRNRSSKTTVQLAEETPFKVMEGVSLIDCRDTLLKELRAIPLGHSMMALTLASRYDIPQALWIEAALMCIDMGEPVYIDLIEAEGADFGPQAIFTIAQSPDELDDSFEEARRMANDAARRIRGLKLARQKLRRQVKCRS